MLADTHDTALYFFRPLCRALCLGALAGLCTSAACSDRSRGEQTCYPEALEWELDFNGFPTGFCTWASNEAPVDDAPTDGSVRGVDGFIYCFEPEEGQICDACPAEETDALLREQFEKECGKPVQYFKRACYHPNPDADGRPQCCYSALIGPLCDPHEERPPGG